MAGPEDIFGLEVHHQGLKIY